MKQIIGNPHDDEGGGHGQAQAQHDVPRLAGGARQCLPVQRGQASDAKEPYRSFAREIADAQAKARLRAEMTLFERDPKSWLLHGPGRESETAAGWSVTVKPADGITESRNALLDPELMQLFHVVMQVLRPHPDISARVAQALTHQGAASASS